MSKIKIFLWLVFLVWLLGHSFLNLLVDWDWFAQIGYANIFFTQFQAQGLVWLLVFLCTAGFIKGNLWLAYQDQPVDHRAIGQYFDVDLKEASREQILANLSWSLTLIPAFLMANVASNHWLEVLGFLNPVSFGEVDSVFALDLSFYVFQYPLLTFVMGMAQFVLILTLLMVGIQSIFPEILIENRPVMVSRSRQKHLSILLSLFFVLLAGEWFLDRYHVLFSKEGVVWGAGYADIHARIPAYWIMVGTSLIVASTICLSVFRNQRSWMWFSFLGYFLTRTVMVSWWPDLIQSYMVAPNELKYESPYLKENIQATQKAYALDRIAVEPFEATYDLTMENIQSNPLTIQNIRVWDDRPLLTTYGQLQEIRTYYDFHDVDIDRYILDGELRQVMLSARELNYDNVSVQAQSWVNEHFQYTHGYGLTMSPVNLVSKEGLPSLFIQDIPPTSKTSLQVSQPEIYYGELTNTHVIVNGDVEEFDYPKGDENVYTKYQGDGGVAIGSFGKRMLYSWYFGNIEILLSNYIQSDSKLLFRRNIIDRVNRLVPFLEYDRDPYLVLHNGRMMWLLDAYTTTRYIPYSEPKGNGQYNYMRNSVKVLMDAYHGTVEFYVADPQDPLIQMYQEVFPEIFHPLQDLDDELRSHLRYPVDFFKIQAAMYQSYHMNDVTVFYNKEDMWDLPKEQYAGKEQRMEAYYLIMKLPGVDSAEFVLLLPFVPTGKDNMISWLAARSDEPNYGRLILYQFPKQKLIYGPRQIEARIDQDPEISKQITLWSQAGSRVVRGNLLVIPIGNSLIYVEPLYLQAESSQLPELKRVIVAYDNHIAMESTLSEALKAVFGEKISDIKKEVQNNLLQNAVEISEIMSTADSLNMAKIMQANQLFEEAIQAQKEGNWSEYGQKIADLGHLLKTLMNASENETVQDGSAHKKQIEISKESPE